MGAGKLLERNRSEWDGILPLTCSDLLLSVSGLFSGSGLE